MRDTPLIELVKFGEVETHWKLTRFESRAVVDRLRAMLADPVATDALRRVLDAFESVGYPRDVVGQWAIPAMDANDLIEALHRAQSQKILEVGTFVGTSALLMLLCCEGERQRVVRIASLLDFSLASPLRSPDSALRKPVLDGPEKPNPSFPALRWDLRSPVLVLISIGICCQPPNCSVNLGWGHCRGADSSSSWQAHGKASGRFTRQRMKHARMPIKYRRTQGLKPRSTHSVVIFAGVCG